MTLGWYERHLLPWLIDLACGVAPIRRQRLLVIPRAEGRVLEVGFGTGLNVPLYDRARVTTVVGVDPALRMHGLARRRIEAAGLDVQLMGLSAETLPAPDASFDTVVSTYTLCTIPDVAAALREMRRVLKPGGRLLFAEHGLAPDAGVAAWQRRLNPLWSPLAGGCRLDRDIPALLREAGFDVDVQSRYLPGPRFVSYHYWGEARG
ncbi:MAG: class I SAM-dependent methyltransferase [Burkholderiaceae bacterium]|nr:class I SAM-dependent methyltransferase [Burkholderiaceae bacterium]